MEVKPMSQERPPFERSDMVPVPRDGSEEGRGTSADEYIGSIVAAHRDQLQEAFLADDSVSGPEAEELLAEHARRLVRYLDAEASCMWPLPHVGKADKTTDDDVLAQLGWARLQPASIQPRTPLGYRHYYLEATEEGESIADALRQLRGQPSIKQQRAAEIAAYRAQLNRTSAGGI